MPAIGDDTYDIQAARYPMGFVVYGIYTKVYKLDITRIRRLRVKSGVTLQSKEVEHLSYRSRVQQAKKKGCIATT
jgi:hypothetical protein